MSKTRFMTNTSVRMLLSKPWLIVLGAIVIVLLLGALASVYGNFAKGTIWTGGDVTTENYEDFLNQISASPTSSTPTAAAIQSSLQQGLQFNVRGTIYQRSNILGR